MNSTTKTILAVVAIAAIGGVAWYLYKKQKAENQTTVTGVTSANPNGASNNTPALAQNISAATGALNAITGVFGQGSV